MKKIFATLVASIGMLATSACGQNPNAQAQDLTPQADAHESSLSATSVAADNQLGYNVLHQLATAQPNLNLMISPASLAISLSMLLNGAQTHTYTAILHTLGLEQMSLDQINQSNESLIKNLNTPANIDDDGSNFVLISANSIWSNSQKGFHFNPAYQATLAQDYNAKAESVDFSAPTGALALNDWASANTQGKISNVIDTNTLQSLACVLMNATYFKGDWQTPFDAPQPEALTATFTTGSGSTVQANMMSVTTSFNYTTNSDMQVVRLPYRGGASMLVLIPNGNNRLADLETRRNGPMNQIFWTNLTTMFAGQDPISMVLEMPKFQFKSNSLLNPSLSALGMADAFTNNADFSKLGSQPVAVSLVKQNTFIKVDENGTEAAAVTIIGPRPTLSTVPPTVHVTIDRPFMVVIVDDKTGSVLFFGSVDNPNAN